MNIKEVMLKVASITGTPFTSLEFARQIDEVEAKGGEVLADGTVATAGQKIKAKSQWLYHWDNDARVRVVFHEDIVSKLKSDPTMGGLALKLYDGTPFKLVAAHGDVADYKRFVVTMPQNIELSISL